MVDVSASWKRLLEASWSRAKTISKEALDVPEPGSSSNCKGGNHINEASVPVSPAAKPTPNEATVRAGACATSVRDPRNEATVAPSLGGTPAVAMPEGALPPVNALGGLLARMLRRGSSVGSQDEKDDVGTSPKACDRAAMRDSIEEQSPTPGATFDIEAIEQRDAAVIEDHRSCHRQIQPAPQTSTGIRSKWGKMPTAPPGSKPASESKEYLVSNKLLQADTSGLAYRLSTQVQDIDAASMARWNSTVFGVDERNGWLRVVHTNGERFLPFVLNNVEVLVPGGSPCKNGSSANGTGHMGRSYSGQRFFSSGGAASTQQLKAGNLGRPQTQQPTTPLKRQPSNPAEPSQPKRRKEAEAPSDEVDLEGRSFDLQTVVVCFSGVAELYATTVLGKSEAKGDKLFDWEGVRRCVRHLRCVLDLQVIGVVFENWRAPDRGTGSHSIPADINGFCASILETPRLTGGKHKVADREMALKCAWRRNCRFVDNDNASDWLHELGDERCRLWLEASQDIVLMRFRFEGTLGVFRIAEAMGTAG
mmetsp:Transcript_44844/g.103612  ORF Transcript_44844/g.103612 Transcript_44844/m.103612 type:complete len:535 (-) Transcript_44844:66-1670(-)|eukprot:CAMPEP_0171059230 /NCGR_PEP_ID=MMETSP0766_2-20121228/3063_1 /TAXON_ID=439317 /ORGANISM="Gambierdiscus australes, Strain CAWD 149" /LENGTH=534 /DNA_ID=CAMNT_0011514653 /DNA_START=31 /DNA_END=1635 /DNA_ORIENTATION=-